LSSHGFCCRGSCLICICIWACVRELAASSRQPTFNIQHPTSNNSNIHINQLYSIIMGDEREKGLWAGCSLLCMCWVTNVGTWWFLWSANLAEWMFSNQRQKPRRGWRQRMIEIERERERKRQRTGSASDTDKLKEMKPLSCFVQTLR